MSLATKEIVQGYRAKLSTRPDGETHVMDTKRITHIVQGSPWPKTRCGIDVHDGGDVNKGIPMLGIGSAAIPTWNDVDCITCLVKDQSP